MLYDGAIRFLRQGAGAYRSGEVEHGLDRVRRAEAIINELNLSLDMSHGELPERLRSIYLYSKRQLSEALLHRSRARSRPSSACSASCAAPGARSRPLQPPRPSRREDGVTLVRRAARPRRPRDRADLRRRLGVAGRARRRRARLLARMPQGRPDHARELLRKLASDRLEKNAARDRRGDGADPRRARPPRPRPRSARLVRAGDAPALRAPRLEQSVMVLPLPGSVAYCCAR